MFKAWTEAAGETWSRHAIPTGYRRGHLYVEVSSSVQLAELRGFHLEGLRTRANKVLGDERIKKVVLKLKN